MTDPQPQSTPKDKWWHIDPASIRTRLIFIFVLLVVLTASAVVVSNIWISLNSGLEHAYKQLETVARLKEEGISRWVDNLEEELTNTSEPEDLRWHMSVLTAPDESLKLFTQTSYNRVKAALVRTLSRTQQFNEFFLLNLKGEVVLSTTEENEKNNFANHPFFQKGMDNFFIESPFNFSTEGKFAAIAAYPVVNTSGKTLGVLAGTANMSRLNQLMSSFERVGDTGETYLLDPKGTLLTPSRFELPIGTVIGGREIAIDLGHKNSIWEQTRSYRGSKVVSVRHWLQALDIILVVEQQEDEAFASVYTALKVSIAVTLVALLFAVSLGIILTRNITEPLANLTQTAARITAGDIDTVATVQHGSTEIIHLADSFNLMTTRLRKLIGAIKRSEQQQRDMLNNTSSVIFIKDLQGRYLFINRMYEELFGIRDSQITGKKDHDFFPSDIADKFLDNDHKVIESGSIIEFEEVVPQNNGLHTYISVKFPLKKSSGEIYAICGISTDITARKQQEDELRKLRNYLYNIINSMPSMLIGVDCDGQITQWNAQAQKVSGINEDEAIGQTLSQVLPRLKPEMDRVFRAIKTRQEQSDHGRLVNLNGDEHYEDITIFPLVANGIEGAVIRIDDVTEQHRIEEMMIQSEKMLSVGGLAAGMAHEINNPLGGIMQTSEVMVERLTGEIPANLRAAEAVGTDIQSIHAYMEKRGIPRMLNTIRDSCHRAATIVETMLDFARRGDSIFSNCDIVELLDQTLLLSGTDYDLKKRYDFKQIEIIRDYDENLSQVTCEPQKLQQVLLNIFRNGAEAMQEQNEKQTSEKTTETSYQPCFTLKLRNETKTNRVRINISDNGPGMKEEIRKRVFEPFFTTKSAGIGTGLGLSVSYFIITENLGGTLSVKSKIGKGTEFSISLPASSGG